VTARPADTAAERDRARKIAVRLLETADRSRAALLERLIERDIAPACAEAVVSELERARLVDDERLAEETVSRTLARGPAARAGLSARLASLGVPAEIAERALDDAFDGRDPVPDAEALARQRVRTMPPTLAPEARARRLAAALARRGFDEDTVGTVVRRIVPEATDSATG